MTYLTPEQFMAQQSTEEDDLEVTEFPAVHVDTGDPLESIADSLRYFVGVQQEHDKTDAAEKRLEEMLLELEEAYRALDAQLDAIKAIIKPSTSKLANAIRDVLDPDTPVGEPAPVPCAPGCVAVGDHTETGCVTHPEQPLHDAPVEEWREHARSLGFEVLDSMNRSQIRTLLGIPQPVHSADVV